MADKVTKGNSDAAKVKGAAKIAEPVSFQFFEQVNLRWRHIAKVGTTSEDLEHPEYLQGIADKLHDFDLVDVFSEDRSHYWQCLVIQGGRDGLGGAGNGRGCMMVLPAYPVQIPAINRGGNDGLPAGYSIEYDSFTRRHIPLWGTLRLDADGSPQRDDARRAVLHHANQASRVAPRAPSGN